MTTIDLKRRMLLRSVGGLAGITVLAPTALLTAYHDTAVAGTNRDGAAHYGLENGPFDVDIRLRAQPHTAPILPGTPSEVWRYTAELRNGPADTITPVGGSYTGPLIRLRRGQRFHARLENGLPEDTTVHWHGLHVPSDVDGQPRLPIKPGEAMTVAFDVVDRAGLYWYHPHPHGPNGGRVGFQSYAGLAGPLVIEDEAERALGLPAGEREMFLVIQDRSFAGDNELTYLDSGMGTMMTRMRGFLGDRILVNGQPDTAREVATRPYRLRILNGSNSRIYKLAWSDGRPMTVLGTDGGLLGAPRQYPFVTLAPAQRIDLWVDLSANEPGDELHLLSDSYQAGMMGDGMGDGCKRGSRRGGRMGNMMGGSELPAGARFDILPLRVTRRERGNERLPKRLAEDLQAPPVERDAPVRRFKLSMVMMRGFAINGRQFEGATVADDEIVHLGSTEVWEFVNDSMMPHPMHVHGLQFAVVGREQIGGGRGWSGLAAGLVDSGLHDTVLVLPGERVRIALTFADFEGLYLYHCHNMEHEDNGMMRYYRVRA
ncbi:MULTISPECIES: multicopper oxidase family protein [Gammaproteobacteria]|uniref:Multicopper oxidase CueO n=1 Tax=Salinisphaera hydrothermalis (strain C41B8) TaxID=1304275 RepID=A0A084IQD8_SALHC|nr:MULTISPECIES: multicopper oxidase family protein [Gammaproteobacteria]KEZ78922.1 Bilirubin oxidase [Salinisphaera hydrothermalis C41B8]MBO9471064.1 multicopper oxidase family protein [Endozoicomonas sp. G2_2]